METKPLTPEEQHIHSTAERLLAEHGKKTEESVYYPPISIGGDFHSKCVRRRFQKEGLIMGDLQETFDDGSGHYCIWVFNAGKGIRGLLHKIGLARGKLVYLVERGKVEVFERGEWQNQLEDLAAPKREYARSYR